MTATPCKPALVVSHERSGTHFLMNTLARNFGYRPYVDLDRGPGFDPGSTPQMLAFLLQGWPPSTVLKSHHEAAFFPLLPRLAERFHLFYVVRDPRDVLLSFWRFLGRSSPETGPRTAHPGELLRAAPSGHIARYQRRPTSSMVERWRLHVEGWLDALAGLEGRGTLVRYHDLDERFPAEVARLAAILDLAVPEEILRPTHFDEVIHLGSGGSGKFRTVFGEADLEFLRREAGGAMRRLGYSPD